MTVKEFKAMTMDTNVIVRDKKDGHFIKNREDHDDMEVCGIYAKAHYCGNPRAMRAEIVVYAKAV